jgi:hypothetical protein
MKDPSFDPADDPALKGALRRALRVESAPAGLRERVVAMTAKPARTGFRRSMGYRLAVAAVLVIGFGGLGYRIWQMNRNPYDAKVVLSDALYQNMIDAHNARMGQAAGGDKISNVAEASSLVSEIKRPVFAADLTRDGWTFQGGSVRNVGNDRAAQLFYTKGKASISVFSLPASAASGAQYAMDYEKVYNGSPIAGFTRSGGLYCIVGSSADGSLQVAEVKRLLTEHRGELVKS